MNDEGLFNRLTKGNYDKWKLYVEALLVNSDNWGYLISHGPTDTNSAVASWEEALRIRPART